MAGREQEWGDLCHSARALLGATLTVLPGVRQRTNVAWMSLITTTSISTLDLTDGEKHDLVEYLTSLSSPEE